MKLEPVAAEISPLSIYRLYYYLDKAEKDEVILIVQFSLNYVNFCIFEGTVPFFMHHLSISFNEDKWERRLLRTGNYELIFNGDSNDLTFQFEDSYKEIYRLMDFYRYSLHQGKKFISKILLHGDHPMLHHIHQDLVDRFEVPVETFLFENSHPLLEKLPYSFYLAFALAIKGV